MNPNTLEYTNQHDKDPLEPADWAEVEKRLDVLGFPDDEHERAEFISGMITSGRDIENIGKALHEVFVPGVESAENEGQGTLIGPEGSVTSVLATPAERRELFDEAAQLIQALSQERQVDQAGESDQAYLHRVANILGTTYVLAHYFEDGNGRLARGIGLIVAAGKENPTWDEQLGGQPGAALRFMTSSKEGQRSGIRNPNRTDSFGNGFSPVGFIPEHGVAATEVLRSTAGVDVPLDDTQQYSKQLQLASSSMRYGE